jgi:hypothetical protein
MVSVGSFPELHKTSPLMFETLHHLGVLDFVVTGHHDNISNTENNSPQSQFAFSSN